MPEVKGDTLRIYCLCGQKMRVSEKMYGLPGKCVACRQKIRIPRKDDVPEGISEIYLKDHPELLRGPARKPSAEERAARKALAAAGQAPDSGEESTPNTELDLADSPPPPDVPTPAKRKAPSRGSLPLDVLPMLQVLSSLDYKFSRQLETLQLNNHEDEVLLAELEGHVSRVRKMRMQLDDQLHQRLMETAIELANTQEKLAQSRLSARVGESGWADYLGNVHRLRTRRDRLERRQQNLRGWLAVRDPFVAGGLLDLSVENIPGEGFAVSLPSESSDEVPLVAELTEGLRLALEERARVRQRMAEVQRMAEGEDSREIAELRKECERQRLVARARVAFFHERLKQLQRDYAADAETANAMLAAARDKLRMDALSRPEYDAFEKEALRSKKDLARAQVVISRALGANAATEVPSPQGTFLQRLGLSGPRQTTPDLLFAYASAALFCVAIFLPSVGTLSLVSTALEFSGSSGAPAWLFLGPLVLAGVIAGCTIVGEPSARGRLYLLAWLGGLVAAAYMLHEAAYSLDPIAAQFRSGGRWFLLPGVVLMIAAGVGLWAASAVALSRERAFRLWPLGAALLGTLVVMLIATDAVGMLRPNPKLEVLPSGQGRGVVRVTNEGGRAIQLLNHKPDALGSYLIIVERHVGANSYPPAKGDGPLWSRSSEGGVLYTISPGKSQDIEFTLPPGEYRAVLDSAVLNEPISFPFQIQGAPAAAPAETAPPPAREQSPLAPQPQAAAPQAEPGPASAPSAANNTQQAEQQTSPNPNEAAAPDNAGVEKQPPANEPAAANTDGAPTVELMGVMTSQSEAPRFSIQAYFPDGTEKRLTLGIGGVVWGDWKIAEFNPDQISVTIRSPKGLLILRRRNQVSLGNP